MSEQEGTVTAWLEVWKGGDEEALEEVVGLLYEELRRIARRELRHERSGHTLEATALLHEAYLKLRRVQGIDWENRAHFLAFSAHVMRRVLVDHARTLRSRKAGAGWRRLVLNEALDLGCEPAPDLVALNDALEALGKLDPRRASVVEMRFFGGFSVEETARLLSLSVETVGRDWRQAKAWLFTFLTVPGGPVREA